MSLLYGCVYIIRFGSMQKTHKAAEWANVSNLRCFFISAVADGLVRIL